jgi:serine/threonine protein phosphatase 1
MLRVYAIGDIHGSLRALCNLIAECERDADGRPMMFVFIGDYIDRGPDSRGVVDYIMNLQARLAANAICLMGNHEALALSAVYDLNIENWILNGGDMTLRSYDASSARELPAAHVAWLRSLRLAFDDGLRLFVHAGINPARPLDQQDRHDLLWIREPFLSVQHDYGRLIVHGHTPTRTGMPDLRRNRLNIDTGAAYGGPLTAAVFVSEQTNPISFIQATEQTAWVAPREWDRKPR